MYLGDFNAGQTVYVDFNTYSSDDPSASITITGLAVTDIEVYKNGSVTQRASDSGYTLLDTDGIDFDGITGIHGFSIDLSDNTTAGFFVAGADYKIVTASITLDGATINFVRTFSIENRASAGKMLSTTIATLASQTGFTLTAGSADNDAYNNCTMIISDPASAIQKAVGLISDYVGASKTITLAEDPGIFTMAAGDNVTIIATSALANVRSINGTLQTANDNGADINAILLDTNELQGDWTNDGRLDVLLDKAAGKYSGGEVWVDTVGGAAGTVSYENGTADNPSNSIANAKIIADALGYKIFRILPNSSITLAANYDNYIFNNHHATIALGGSSVSNAIINGGVITGNDDGTNASPTQYCFCFLSGNTLGQFVFTDCYISGTTTIAEAGTYRLHDCKSATAGLGTPNLDFGAGIGVSNVNMRNFSGGIELENMGNIGADKLTYEGMGQIILNANCNPANSPVIAVRGLISPLTDNVVGGFESGGGTISQNARYDKAQVLSAITDDDTQIDASQLNTHAAISPALASVATEARLAELDPANLPTDIAAIPTTAMRGTDSAALASVATEARLAELDAANLPTDIAAIPTTAMRGTDSAALASVATEARLAELDAANLPTDIAAIPTTAMRGTDSAALASVATEARLAELDPANLPADVGTLLTRITALIATKAQMDTAHALLATPAQVNTEVSDVIKTDTYALPGQGAPTATPTLEEAIMFLFKQFRNKETQTATEYALYADNTTTKDQKATVSDDATTFIKGEMTTGA